MPKIIENLREQLLSEAKKQVKERGYAATTVRSVAGACGVGVGTVYNYFKSKEMLIATFVYDDWRNHLAEMERLPDELTNHFAGTNMMIIFPDQYGDAMDEMTFAQPQHTEEKSAYELLREWLKGAATAAK